MGKLHFFRDKLLSLNCEGSMSFLQHLFLINNNFTFLMAERIISLQKLSPENVTLVLVRNFALPPEWREQYRWIRCDSVFQLLSQGLITQLLPPWQGVSARRIFHETIRKATRGNAFEAYLYHTSSLTADLILSMPTCTGYHIVEEGTLSYQTHLDCRKKYSFREQLELLLNKLLVSWHAGSHSCRICDCSSPGFRGIYCSSPLAFPGLPNKTVVGYPFVPMPNPPDNIRAILVFDGGVLANEQEEKNIEYIFHHAAKSKLALLHYKFHPAWSESKKQRFREFIKQQARFHGLAAEELERSFLLENFACHQKDQLSVYTVLSSAGIYAVLCECKVFSTADHFRESGNKIDRLYSQLSPEIVRKIIQI